MSHDSPSNDVKICMLRLILSYGGIDVWIANNMRIIVMKRGNLASFLNLHLSEEYRDRDNV